MLVDNPVTWPNGAKCAVLLTFDFDAEEVWIGEDPANADRPGVLSQGTYGAKVAVPLIGKKMEPLVVDAIRAGLQKEHDLTREWTH